jgi:isohexenylglutaconyl-CoA hydratase
MLTNTLVTLELEQTQGWLTIWLNQVAQRNALTDAMVTELLSTLEAIRDDASIRGVTLRGRGGVFCAGGDLQAFKQLATGAPEPADIYALSCRGAALFDALNTLPQIVLVVVEGAAMAGGLGMACCADVVLADAGATFAFTETLIGLSPAQIAPFVLQKVGYGMGRRLLLTAERLSAEAALTAGLIDHVVADERALNAAEYALRERVLACAPGAIAETKMLLRRLPTLPRESAIDAAAQVFTNRVLSEEGREGVAAFLAKRPPQWVVKPTSGET